MRFKITVWLAFLVVCPIYVTSQNITNTTQTSSVNTANDESRPEKLAHGMFGTLHNYYQQVFPLFVELAVHGISAVAMLFVACMSAVFLLYSFVSMVFS